MQVTSSVVGTRTGQIKQLACYFHGLDFVTYYKELSTRYLQQFQVATKWC